MAQSIDQGYKLAFLRGALTTMATCAGGSLRNIFTLNEPVEFRTYVVAELVSTGGREVLMKFALPDNDGSMGWYDPFFVEANARIKLELSE